MPRPNTNARRDAYSALVRKFTGLSALGAVGATGGIATFIATQAPTASASTKPTHPNVAIAPRRHQHHHAMVAHHALVQASKRGAATPARHPVTTRPIAPQTTYVPSPAPVHHAAPVRPAPVQHVTPAQPAPVVQHTTAPKAAPQPAPASAPAPAPPPPPPTKTAGS